MDLKLKQYKLLKTKMVIENNSLLLISNKLNLDHENFSTLKKNYKFYLVRNRLLKKLLKRSVIYNLSFLINGNIVLIASKKTVSDVLDIKNRTPFIGLILNRKLYSVKQLNKLKNLNYNSNIKELYNLLNFNLMFNSATLKKVSK
jgi:hypothetical protein